MSEPKDWGKCGGCLNCEDIADSANGCYRKCTKSGHKYIAPVVYSCPDYEPDGKYSKYTESFHSKPSSEKAQDKKERTSHIKDSNSDRPENKFILHCGDVSTIAVDENGDAHVAGSMGLGDKEELKDFFENIPNIVSVSSGLYANAFTAIDSDGDIFVYADEESPDYEMLGVIDDWCDLKKTVVGYKNIVGLCNDGTVYFAGETQDGCCYDMDEDDWNDIVDIACGLFHTAGLKSDGTVIVSKRNPKYGKSTWNCGDWKNIVQISCGSDHIAALTADGKVLSCGDNEHGQCNTSSWSDVSQVMCFDTNTFAIKNDGTVLACGNNENGQCNVSGWQNIIQLSCDPDYGTTVGLCADGHVEICGNTEKGRDGVKKWTDVVYITSSSHIVGVKKDGSVVACGNNIFGQCNVEAWRIFNTGINNSEKKSTPKSNKESAKVDEPTSELEVLKEKRQKIIDSLTKKELKAYQNADATSGYGCGCVTPIGILIIIVLIEKLINNITTLHYVCAIAIPILLGILIEVIYSKKCRKNYKKLKDNSRELSAKFDELKKLDAEIKAQNKK